MRYGWYSDAPSPWDPAGSLPNSTDGHSGMEKREGVGEGEREREREKEGEGRRRGREGGMRKREGRGEGKGISCDFMGGIVCTTL